MIEARSTDRDAIRSRAFSRRICEQQDPLQGLDSESHELTSATVAIRNARHAEGSQERRPGLYFDLMRLAPIHIEPLRQIARHCLQAADG